MTYIEEISEHRRQIDRIDNEIIEKIIELSTEYKQLKQVVNSEKDYNILESTNMDKAAQMRNLDPWLISRIFNEIRRLILEMEVNPL